MRSVDELKAEIETLRVELAAWRSAMQLIEKSADEARRELGGPFGLTPPSDLDQVAAFLDRRTMLLHRIAQADTLRVMWQGEAGRPGANALLLGKLMQRETDLDRAVALADPRRDEIKKRVADIQFRRAIGAE